jgi:hypothetical protein
MSVEREEVVKEKRARYRRIEVRMWGDEKFRNLSPLPPCGQGLWMYLLTGPHTSAIPGLFKAGRAAMAEDLNWELEAFDEAFREAYQQGMVKADWKAKVVWVPNALACNKPESLNVVKSWRDSWDLLPECDLKREAYEHMRAFVCGLGKAFEMAFDMAIVMPYSAPGVAEASTRESTRRSPAWSACRPNPAGPPWSQGGGSAGCRNGRSGEAQRRGSPKGPISCARARRGCGMDSRRTDGVAIKSKMC